MTYYPTYTTDQTTNQTKAIGYTCNNCKMWVSPGEMHQCNWNPQYQYYACQKCGAIYTQGTYHQCTVIGTGTLDYSYQLSQIIGQLADLAKRLEKIEKILDEEL